MELLLTLTGRGNTITTTYYPPIHLSGQGFLGLLGLYTSNAIRNVTEDNNIIYYGTKKLIIPPGAYEISELNKYIQTQLSNATTKNKTYISEQEMNKIFSLRANNNTLKVELQSTFDIDFTKQNSIGRMLGFSPSKLKANQVHCSDLDVQIVKTTCIKVECNITSGAFTNSKPSHTVFVFDVSVEPGFRLVKEPHNIVYLPVTVQIIDSITLDLVNQHGEPVNLGEEEVTVVLQLKHGGEL